VKENHPEMHVSCGYRNEAAQNDAVAQGKSHEAWPHSLHNQKPSLAIDLFQLDGGHGYWISSDMAMIDRENIKNGIKVKWGGNFETLKDFDHFELPKL
jgi:peptidoglycan LD-endopeptidase CwlK